MREVHFAECSCVVLCPGGRVGAGRREVGEHRETREISLSLFPTRRVCRIQARGREAPVGVSPGAQPAPPTQQGPQTPRARVSVRHRATCPMSPAPSHVTGVGDSSTLPGQCCRGQRCKGPSSTAPDLLWGAGSHRRKVRKKRRALRPECDHLGQGGRFLFKGTDQRPSRGSGVPSGRRVETRLKAKVRCNQERLAWTP